MFMFELKPRGEPLIKESSFKLVKSIQRYIKVTFFLSEGVADYIFILYMSL